MDEKIKILRKYNFWDSATFDFGFPRPEYTNKVRDYIGNRLVKVLIGQRRTGKSYIMRQIAKEMIGSGINPQNIIFINRELTDFEFLKTHKDLEELIELYRNELKPSGKIYIFIDEIQLIDEWEKPINSYSQDYTTEYEVFISGFNSKMLSGELATLLSGRYVEFKIYPFSYTEYTGIGKRPQGKESFLSYMNTGGLPELFSLPDKQEIRQNYMASIKDSILLKDIIQRHKIRDPKLLDDLFSFLVNNASNLISTSSIVNYFKGKNRKTSYDAVSSYIGYIEESFLIHRCDRYDIKGKEVLAGTSKFYINDLAYKNFLYAGFAYGIGYKLENLIYLELKRAGYDIYTGSSKDKEVDFVAKKNDRTIYIQRTYSLADEQTAKREYAPLETIRDNYEKIVVSLDDLSLPSNNGIRHIQAWKLHSIL